MPASVPTPSTPARLLAGALILMLLPLTLLSARWLLADVHARPAIHRLDDWRAGKVELLPEDWQAIEASLQRATVLHPHNADYLQWTALAVEAPYRSAAAEDDGAREARQQAYQLLQQAAGWQPDWPFVWVEMAILRHRMRLIDVEFYEALRRALDRGPWEPGVLRVAGTLAILYWNDLPEQDHPAVLAAIRRLYSLPRPAFRSQIERLLVRRGLDARVCEDTAQSPALAAFCAARGSGNG